MTRAAAVPERALQRDRRVHAAIKTRVAGMTIDEMMNVEGVRTRCDCRRQKTAEVCLDKTRSEGRDV